MMPTWDLLTSVALLTVQKTKAVSVLKMLSKIDVLKRRESVCFMDERDALVAGLNTRWIVELQACFQDSACVYVSAPPCLNTLDRGVQHYISTVKQWGEKKERRGF